MDSPEYHNYHNLKSFCTTLSGFVNCENIPFSQAQPITAAPAEAKLSFSLHFIHPPVDSATAGWGAAPISAHSGIQPLRWGKKVLGNGSAALSRLMYGPVHFQSPTRDEQF